MLVALTASLRCTVMISSSAGRGADVIDAGNGNNIILGDAGVITATNAGELWAGRDDIRVGEIATSYGLVDGVNPDGIDRITTGLGYGHHFGRRIRRHHHHQ